jgi:hypothetical protein
MNKVSNAKLLKILGFKGCAWFKLGKRYRWGPGESHMRSENVRL